MFGPWLMQSLTIENWKKVTSSDESQFLLQYSDGIGSDFQSMRALIHVVQAGNGVKGAFSWCTLGLLVQMSHSLNATTYHVHTFMTAVYHSFNI